MSLSIYCATYVFYVVMSLYVWPDAMLYVAGNAIDDLNMGDFQYLSFVDDAADQDKGDTASVCSSLSAGLASSMSISARPHAYAR